LKHSPRALPRSFRIDEKALDVLQEEARRRHVNPSSMLNQFVVAYAEYGRFAEQMEAVSMSRQTFLEVLNATTDEALARAARQAGRNAVPAYVGTMRGPLTLETLRDLMEVLSKHAHLFQFNEIQDNFGSHWTLIHELGPKWSLFLANYIGEALALTKVPEHHEVSERSVIFWLNS